MKLNPKTLKIAGITLLVIIVLIIAVVLYQKVVKDINERKYAENLPNNGSGIPTDGVDNKGNAKSWNPLPLVEELHEALYKSASFSWSGIDLGNTSAKTAVYAKLMSLTDDQFAATFTAYNARYMEEDKDGTLRDVIEDEYFEDQQGNSRKVIDRMIALDFHKAESKDKSWF